MNSNDPLKTIADGERALFEKFCRDASGHTTEQVVSAALNVIVNAMKQSFATRDAAMQATDRLMNAARQGVAANYDILGRRINGAYPLAKGIFASRI